MSKININDITTQYGFKDAINARLQQIEDEFNNKVFYRNNPTGEPNSLDNDLDMGNNDILNINKITVNDIGVVGESSFKELIEEAKQAVIDCTEQTTLSTLQANSSAYSASQSSASASAAATSASEAQAAALLVDPRMDAVEVEVAAQTTSINTFKNDVSNIFGALIGSIQSIFCSDSYVPLGMVPANGTEYSRSQFPDLYDNFLVGEKLLTTDYTSFTTQVGLTGNCAKFALDTTNQKFKVPLLKDGDSITQAASAAELGKSIKAGVPNATGTIGDIWDANMATGICAKGDTLNNLGANNGSAIYAPVNIDLSRASSVYRNDVTTVLTDGVRLRHFVVVASAQNNASVFDWSNYMAALNGKINTDFSNVDLTKCNIVLQQVRYESKSVASGTTTIPMDSTIPQINEGDQYLAATITPKKANSILLIEAELSCTSSVASITVGALFRDTNANAIAASWSGRDSAGGSSQLRLRHFEPSGSTAPTTFKVRAGNGSAWPGTFTINSASLGGVAVSSLIITEYAA